MKLTISSFTIDLHGNSFNLSLYESGKQNSVNVGGALETPGDQSESQLRAAAVAKAEDILSAALKSLKQQNKQNNKA